MSSKYCIALLIVFTAFQSLQSKQPNDFHSDFQGTIVNRHPPLICSYTCFVQSPWYPGLSQPRSCGS